MAETSWAKKKFEARRCLLGSVMFGVFAGVSALMDNPEVVTNSFVRVGVLFLGISGIVFIRDLYKKGEN